MLIYRWENAREALLRLAEVESDPFDDVILEYVEPRTGNSVLPCIGAYLQMIRPGIETRAHRHNSSAIYFAWEGSGTTAGEWNRVPLVEGRRPGDCSVGCSQTCQSERRAGDSVFTRRTFRC